MTTHYSQTCKKTIGCPLTPEYLKANNILMSEKLSLILWMKKSERKFNFVRGLTLPIENNIFLDGLKKCPLEPRRILLSCASININLLGELNKIFCGTFSKNRSSEVHTNTDKV